MSNTPKTDAIYAAHAERIRALEDLRTLVAALRNESGRIDLTDSSKRQSVYALVHLAEGIGPT